MKLKRVLFGSSPTHLREVSKDIELIDFGTDTQRQVLALIHQQAPTTRAAIAEASGLTPAAITKITKKMIDEGLIEVTGKQKGSRGQPGIELGVNPRAAYSLGVNIELETISVELVDLKGEAVFSKAIQGIYSEPMFAIDELSKLLDVTRVAFEEEFSKLIGVGVTTSCNFNPESSKVTMPPHLSEWESIDIRRTIEEKLSLPCWIENDGNAAALGESVRSRRSLNANFFYLYLGYGVGGGHYYSGKTYRGARGNAGRIGKLFPDRNNRPSLSCLYDKLGLSEPSPHRADTLSTLLSKNPEKVAEWKANAQMQLVSALQAIRAICDPNEIIIGGLLPPQLVDELHTSAISSLEQYLEPNEVMPTIIPAKTSGGKIAATGAAMLPLYNLAY